MKTISFFKLLRSGVLLLLPFLLITVWAQGSELLQTAVEPILARSPLAPLAINADDGGAWEVGTEQAGDNLQDHANAESYGLYMKLGSCGWNQRYRYSDAWSWEQDFKRAAAGGTENSYLDAVDLQFYVGHGGPGYFTFVSNVDDHYLQTSDCYRSWGDGDNEWVALTSCQVLADDKLIAWAQCMYGTHLILGFKTNAAAYSNYLQTTGYWFGYYLCNNYTVAQAWYKAADRAQPAGRIVRAVINELEYLNDRPMSSYVGGPDSYDWDAWVQTHTAGSELARFVDVNALNGVMPIYQSPPLSLEEAQNLYTNLGEAFGVPTSRHLSLTDDPIWTDVVDGRELEMDSSAGLYGYTDLNVMWTFTQTNLALTNRAPLLTPEEARVLADRFLIGNNLMPPDAQFYEVAEDTISGGDIVSGTHALDALLANEQPVMYQVIYSRILTYTPPALNGVTADPVEFSVIGPGAKQKVYVDPTDVALFSENSSAIVGVLGGWRPLAEQPGMTMVAGTVEILTPAQIYLLHEELARLVVLNEPPIEADDATITAHTVAYWESGAGTDQSEMIPVYALTVNYLLDGAVVATDDAYIPANPTYMRPYAAVQTYPQTRVNVGDTVLLTAVDASANLSDLGYDASLNFPLGSGQPEDYIYNWYVGSVDPANLIGVGRSINYTIWNVSENRNAGPTQQIFLVVTDIANPDQPGTMTSVSIDLNNRVFLPMVVR